MSNKAWGYITQIEDPLLQLWGLKLLESTPDEFAQFIEQEITDEVSHALDINGMTDLTPTSLTSSTIVSASGKMPKT